MYMYLLTCTKYKNDKQEIIPLTNNTYINRLLIGYEELKFIIFSIVHNEIRTQNEIQQNLNKIFYIHARGKSHMSYT